MTAYARTPLVAVVALLATACGGTNQASTPQPAGSVSVTQTGTATTSPNGTVPSNPAELVPDQAYKPDLPDPADFVVVIDNPYLPLLPGSISVLEGISGGQRERNVVVVTDRTKVILGITATVVHDRVFASGELAEDTYDWYAQDWSGNVWYLGEDTAEYEDGEVVSTEGSWQAGVDGALPGIVMLADPLVGQAYHQEYLAGEAEDVGRVAALGRRVDVPYGPLDGVLVTEDTTPLEPDLLEHKFYAPGIGVVLERVIRGGEEVSRLVEFTSGA